MKHILIDQRGKLFGKYDLFLPLFFLIIITLVYFIGKVLVQKDEYVTAELFASGGDWWWNTPHPPYWLTDPIEVGNIEYDSQGNAVVEVLEVRTYEASASKMMWLKVKLKVSSQNKGQQYQFKREPLQVGSLVQVAPNNVKLFANVISLSEEAVTVPEQVRIITLKSYDQYPWQVDPIHVGDQFTTQNGRVLAEILEKRVVDAEILTVDNLGNTHVRQNPLKRDTTLKIKLQTTQSKGRDYFASFQAIKVGFELWIPFNHINVSGTISQIE